MSHPPPTRTLLRLPLYMTGANDRGNTFKRTTSERLQVIAGMQNFAHQNLITWFHRNDIKRRNVVFEAVFESIDTGSLGKEMEEDGSTKSRVRDRETALFELEINNPLLLTVCNYVVN